MIGNFDFRQFKAIANTVTFETNSSYINSYPEFIHYFHSLNEIDTNNLIISSHFVYGWMPTILRLDTRLVLACLPIINKTKKGVSLKSNEIEVLKSTLNNSLVGVSKLLHFVAPKNYAIWDSRIYRFLFNKEPYDYRIGNIESYLEYLRMLAELSKNVNYPKIHNQIEERLGYSVTAMRAIEVVIFQFSKTNNLNF